jgi:LysW-gamma-L-lysine carboxypeptidase
MKNYEVHLLKKMLEIYSPSEEEEKIGQFLKEEMTNLGFDVRIDEVGNVIGEIGNGSPKILLCGHMDTVPKYIPVLLKEGILYGRGAVDAKASLAAMIIAAHLLAKDMLTCKISVIGVVGEERSSRGIKKLLEDDFSADYAVFGEPSGVTGIIIGYKGSLHLKITCKTETGHSAAPWLFENAIEKAFEIWMEIKHSHLSQENLESPFHSVTYCLTKSTGGESTSVVPSNCIMHLDIRIPPELSCQQVLDNISDLVKTYQASNPKVSLNLEVQGSTEPFEQNKKSLLVHVFGHAIRKITAKTPTLLRKTGTGDMNIFGEKVKIPIITYGPGDSKLDHTMNEHIEVQEYLDSIQVYRTAIQKLCNLHDNQKH